MSTPVPLPPNFIDLSAAFALKDRFSNIIGIVVDSLPAARSRGTDYTLKFTLHDRSWYEGLGLQVRYFRRDEKSLPVIKNNGDIVILRSLRCKDYQSETVGLSNGSTSWTVLDGQSIFESTEANGSDIRYEKSATAPVPAIAELQYAKWLHLNTDPGIFQEPQKPTVLQVDGIQQVAGERRASTGNKFKLIKDLEVPGTNEMSFAEIICEVRRTFKNDFRVELYVTDYTSHEALYNYVHGCDEEGIEGDPFGYTSRELKAWPGPWGKMSIQITLWDSHAAYASTNVSEGDYLFLKNVSLRLDKSGSKLEGHCRGERINPTRVNVIKIFPKDANTDERMKELLRRRKEYERNARVQNQRFLDKPQYQKQKSEDALDNHADDIEIKKEERPKSKHKRNQRKKQLLKEKRAEAAKSDQCNSKPSASKSSQLNVHVKCADIDVPLLRVEEILSPEFLMRKSPKGNDFCLPFQNCCYKSKVRVVDFVPNDIADFAQAHRISDYEVLNDSDNNSDVDSQPELTQSGYAEIQWEWRFALVVEDAVAPLSNQQMREQMLLVVGNDDAPFLMRNLDPCDFRKHPAQLSILREKLWALWGDLEERKSEAKPGEDYGAMARSVPFECLIKEYGVRMRDENGKLTDDVEYERMFGLFKTTIK